MIYVIETVNQTVVRNNFDIIEDSSRIVDDVKVLNQDNYLKEKYKKDSIVFTGSLTHAFKLIFTKRIRNVCVWVQGILPEESYLRKKSKLRFKILSFIEKKVLIKAKLLVFVSDEMKNFYEKKYKITIKNYAIMPCFNTGINLDSFRKHSKYNENIFVYAGGTAKWQNLDEIVEAYSLVEPKLKKPKFLFLVSDSLYAEKLVRKYRVKNYEIKYVSKNQLPLELSKAKFGFVLRQDNEINRVSTPTKLSTYLSCGIIPVYSKCIRDFDRMMSSRVFKIVYEKESFLEKVVSFERMDPKSIEKEYQEIFDNYYSYNKYVNLISEKIRELQHDC